MELGLKRGTVALQPHDDAWEKEAQKTIGELKKILSDAIIDAQHVGSTAIRDIWAKPILDIAVGVKDFADVLSKNAVLEENGFLFRGQDQPEQYLYVCGDQDIRTHHIHVVLYGSVAWNNYLNLRDYLNSHPKDAKAYSDLKRSLAKKYPEDRNTYTAQKAPFIQEILEKARLWRKEENMNEAGVKKTILVDAHCHLGSRQYDNDRAEVVERMLEKGVEKAILISCSQHDLLLSHQLRQQNSGFRLALSVHPQDLEEDHGDDRLERVRQAIEEYKPDMIGETGLDYYSHPHTKEAQIRFFEAQLEMAESFHLPVNIHSRKASADTLGILQKHSLKGVMHSYSGSYEMAMRYIQEGYLISFGASVLFEGSKRPRDVAARIPLEKLLIETDSPYQSPEYNKRHEPADVIGIYEEICRLRHISMRELAEAVERNFDSLFAD